MASKGRSIEGHAETEGRKYFPPPYPWRTVFLWSHGNRFNDLFHDNHFQILKVTDTSVQARPMRQKGCGR